MSAQGPRDGGYAEWRLIAEDLRREILDGERPVGSRLPTEGELADRFGVNRHTVRRALAELAGDGLVIPRQGSGTFVAEHSVLMHRIGLRTRFSDSLARSGAHPGGRLLAAAVESDPPPAVIEGLALGDRSALRLETVRMVDELTISRATGWFDAEMASGLAEEFAQLGSMTAALTAIGITDYVRASTVLGARLATAAESADLGVARGAVVLVARSLDTLADGTPLQFGVARMRADRVELEVEAPVGDTGAGPG